MYDANPYLTWRDVQEILVQTSRMNDPSDSSWNTNGAGHDVSHKYGFGAVDAGAAVSMALNWTTLEQKSTRPTDRIYLTLTFQMEISHGANSQSQLQVNYH